MTSPFYQGKTGAGFLLTLVLAALLLPALATAQGGDSGFELITPPYEGAPVGVFSTYLCGMSDDGTIVVFDSNQDHLIPNHTNPSFEIYVYNRAANTLELTTPPIRDVESCTLSGNGQYLLYQTSDAVDPADTNQAADLYRYEMATGETRWVTRRVEETPFEQYVNPGAISADGTIVAFWSEAPNLVQGDVPGTFELFVADLSANTIERLFQCNCYEAGSPSAMPALSMDGRYIAFHYRYDDLIPEDRNGYFDQFRHDRVTGETVLISLRTDGSQVTDNSTAGNPSISRDGQVVMFTSGSPLDPDDINGDADVYVRDLTTNTTERVSVTSGGYPIMGASRAHSISGDGRYVLFSTERQWIDPRTSPAPYPDFNHVYLYDRVMGLTHPITLRNDDIPADGTTWNGAMTPDADTFIIQSYARNLTNDPITLNLPTLFLRFGFPAATPSVVTVSAWQAAQADDHAWGLAVAIFSIGVIAAMLKRQR